MIEKWQDEIWSGDQDYDENEQYRNITETISSANSGLNNELDSDPEVKEEEIQAASNCPQQDTLPQDTTDAELYSKYPHLCYIPPYKPPSHLLTSLLNHRSPQPITKTVLQSIFSAHEASERDLHLKMQRRAPRSKFVPFQGAISLKKIKDMRELFEKYRDGQLNMQFKDMAVALSLGVRTLFRYWREFKNDPTLAKWEAKIGQNPKTLLVRRGEDTVTTLRRKALLKLLQMDRKWSLSQLCARLNSDPSLIKIQKGKQFISRSDTICKLLQQEGYRRVRSCKIAPALNPIALSERKQFCKTFLSFHDRAISAFYFLAKQVDLRFQRAFGWYKQGEWSEGQKAEKGVMVSAFAGTNHSLSWQVSTESFTPQLAVLQFLKFANSLSPEQILQLKLLVCERNEEMLTPQMVDLLRRLRFHLLFLPIKDHQLSPLAIWLSKLRRQLPNKDFHSSKELKQEFEKADSAQLAVNFKDYSRQSLRYLRKALQGEAMNNVD